MQNTFFATVIFNLWLIIVAKCIPILFILNVHLGGIICENANEKPHRWH
jgi:hypothetical protein